MVITSFEPVERAARPAVTLFRGRDGYYWKRHIFNGLKPYDPDDDNDTRGKSFDFLVIFDPGLFWDAEAEGTKRIMDHLMPLDPEKEHLFSVDGKPFFAISRGAFNRLKLDLKAGDGLIARLRDNGNVRNMVMDRAFRVLDLRKEWRAVENVVIAHQAAVLKDQGVIIEDFGHFFIEGLIAIGEETRISSSVVIKGNSSVGKNVHLYPHVYIENSTVGDNCTLLPGCIVMDSILEESVRIGPYTHLRNGAVVKTGAEMGNFVEMKKSVLGEGSKAMHLTYIGDAEVGKNVNIGAGTITCNYDGVRKNKTVIEDSVFIGSGTELVAPVVVKKNSYIGAGSTITREVPEDSLAVARGRQRNIPGWVTDKKGKKVCKM